MPRVPLAEPAPKKMSLAGAHKTLPLDAKLDYAAAEAAGWSRHRAARRLQLPRLVCRRAIEV